jgi:hypothetical protein
MHIIAALSAEFWTNFAIGVLTLAVGIAVLWITIVQFVRTKHSENQRKLQQEEMSKRLRQLTDLIGKGQDLQNTPPTRNDAPATASQWIQSAEAWVVETNRFLRNCSEPASIAFMNDAGTWAWTMVVTPAIFASAHQEYRILTHRLENLHSILDNQDVYLRPK